MSRIIKPQKGPQEQFLSTNADIAIYGGAAGGGKTFALLMEPLRYINIMDYRAVIFRRNYTQISVAGGLWDESVSMYSGIRGAVGAKSPKYHWTFSRKATIYFDYLGRDEDVNDWQGSQITFIAFDELTHFTERQFFYMLSRNRSTCGVKPYVRATCNPDADSWVLKIIEWWIDPETGYPIKERSGKLRYMARQNETIIWGNTKDELIEQGIKPLKIKSVTFIASTLQDNQVLMQLDPSYLANLEALPLVERERLLYGNWKIKSAAGLFFKRTQIGDMLPVVPKDVTAFVRAWDLAATSETEDGEPAYTAGVLMGRRANGRFIVIDVINKRLSAGDVRATIRHTAMIDNAKYGNVKIRYPQDPGQAGKAQAQSFALLLAGFNFKSVPVTGSKETRAEPAAAQWQAGNIDVLVADWNEEYFSQLESFPNSKYKDMVDATSDAFSELVQITEYNKLVYPSFSEVDNVYDGENDRDTSSYRRYIAVGYSAVSPTVFLELVDDGDIVKVKNEYYSNSKPNGNYISEFEQFAGRAENIGYVVLNEEAEAFKNPLRNKHYRIKVMERDSQNTKKDILKVNTMFSLKKLLVNQKCKNLIAELQRYIWDERAAERGEEKPIKTQCIGCEILQQTVSSLIYKNRRIE